MSDDEFSDCMGCAPCRCDDECDCTPNDACGWCGHKFGEHDHERVGERPTVKEIYDSLEVVKPQAQAKVEAP